MGFTEITFLFVFLPASIVLYLLADKVFHNDTVDNVLLVVLSIAFYYWAGKETLAMFLFIAVFTYMAGRVLSSERKRANIVFPIVFLTGTLVLPETVEIIGEGAFARCSGFTGLVISGRYPDLGCLRLVCGERNFTYSV